jgi:hypothetical protein
MKRSLINDLTGFSEVLKDLQNQDEHHASLTKEDEETIELMFNISKNDDERHGKMPKFGTGIQNPQRKDKLAAAS